MKTRSIVLLLLAALADAARAAPPPTAAGLLPCAFAATELQAVFGIVIESTSRSDMSLPNGRDVGCYYTVKDSSLTFAIRQVWDNNRRSTAPAAALAGQRVTALAGDPDGAVFRMQEEDRPGAGGELVYVRGRVETHVRIYGGRLTGAEVLQRIGQLRRIP